MQAPLDFFFCQDAYWNDQGSLTGGCVFHDISAEILLRETLIKAQVSWEIYVGQYYVMAGKVKQKRREGIYLIRFT